MQKLSLRLFGLFGIILFAPLFTLTFLDPQLIEKSASGFVEWKLQSEVNEKIDAIELPEASAFELHLGEWVQQERAKLESQLAQAKEQIKADTPALVAEQIAKLRNLSCECREKWEERLRDSLISNINSLEIAKARLVDFSHAKYMQIVTKLTLDVRIFLGSNLAVFLLLLLASLLKPAALKHLFLPAGLMLASTLICSYFYLFEQNWFYTIIYNDYTGYSFIGYLALVFAILWDIVLNKARITTEIINGMANALGQAANLSPC